MTKTLLSKFTSLALALSLGCVGFTSCNDNDREDQQEQARQEAGLTFDAAAQEEPAVSSLVGTTWTHAVLQDEDDNDPMDEVTKSLTFTADSVSLSEVTRNGSTIHKGTHAYTFDGKSLTIIKVEQDDGRLEKDRYTGKVGGRKLYLKEADERDDYDYEVYDLQ